MALLATSGAASKEKNMPKNMPKHPRYVPVVGMMFPLLAGISRWPPHFEGPDALAR